MKKFSNKMLGGLKQKPNTPATLNDVGDPIRINSNAGTVGSGNATDDITDWGDNETPVAAAGRLVRTFCMSEVDEAGAEVALLPSIVEAAESSPAAAAECARFIRKFMYREYWNRPNFVYNAIMLMRILVENPGLTFTRNMDKKFVDTVRELLRSGQTNVVHFLMEALQDFEAKGAVDEGLGRIVEMWQKEKSKSKAGYEKQKSKSSRGHTNRPSQAWVPGGQETRTTYDRDHHRGSGNLPRPQELRKRLEEARTTSSLLAEVVNTNSAAALLKHELAGDLSTRCRRATTQVLEYLDATNPPPDNTEMVALLTTHETLQQSLHHYHRAVLDARKQLGFGEARRGESGQTGMEMTPAGKGKGAAPTSPIQGGPGDGGSGEASRGGVGGETSNDFNWGSGVPRTGNNPEMTSSALPYRYGASAQENDDEMMAAAMAASTAPGGDRHARHRFEDGSGPANEVDNPFADNGHAGSSRSSSQVRQTYVVAGGSSSAGGAGGGAATNAYVHSDSEQSDEEYLRQQRRKGKGGSSSQLVGGLGTAAEGPSSVTYSAPPVPARKATYGEGGSGSQPRMEVSPVEADDATAYSRPAAGSAAAALSSHPPGPAMDAEAHSTGQYGSRPVYRY